MEEMIKGDELGLFIVWWIYNLLFLKKISFKADNTKQATFIFWMNERKNTGSDAQRACSFIQANFPTILYVRKFDFFFMKKITFTFRGKFLCSATTNLYSNQISQTFMLYSYCFPKAHSFRTNISWQEWLTKALDNQDNAIDGTLATHNAITQVYHCHTANS